VQGSNLQCASKSSINKKVSITSQRVAHHAGQQRNSKGKILITISSQKRNFNQQQNRTRGFLFDYGISRVIARSGATKQSLCGNKPLTSGKETLSASLIGIASLRGDPLGLTHSLAMTQRRF